MTKPLIATAMAVAVWVLLLPGLLIRDRTGSLSPPWRPILLVVLGVAVLALGCWLVWTAADRLAAAGISPFAAHAGPVLLTDGIFGKVRNPMDLGNTLVGLAPAIAVDVVAVWIVPLAAFLYYAVGRGPLENYYLREKFGEAYEDYRARVPSWTPLWK
ncbi:MAG: hypothetical protein MUP76_02295 [Acidimicrobiia bacterium]|nr:hypothetical protein [Acidimicrobiia bacterium]